MTRFTASPSLKQTLTVDLSAIHAVYEKDPRGQPPYDPRMMTNVLVYAYGVGVYGARKIQQRLSEGDRGTGLRADQSQNPRRPAISREF